MKTLWVLLGLMMISGCSWVTLSEAGEQVTIVKSIHVAQCKEVGTVSAKTRTTVIGDASRNDARIANEVSLLARNEAVKLNANTLVPISEIVDGSRSYLAYQC